jgi:integrase
MINPRHNRRKADLLIATQDRKYSRFNAIIDEQQITGITFIGEVWGLVAREVLNPAAGIQHFRGEKRRRYVTPTEMPHLAAALDADLNEYAAHALWLLLLPGCRRNEILGAKSSDIDWERRTLYIGKTKKWRGAACAPKLRGDLALEARFTPRTQ